MPFDAATTFIDKYLDNRQTTLLGGKPLTWSTDGKVTYKAMVDDLFDGDTENDKWATLRAKDGRTQDMIGIRNKIGWLAACNRDMRTQFAAAIGCRQRVALDHVRYNVIKLRWASNGFKRFMEIVKGRLPA